VSPTYTAAVPAAGSRSATATPAAAGSQTYTVALDLLSPDDPANAQLGKAYCSVAFECTGSPLWILHEIAVGPSRDTAATDLAFNAPGVTVPIGVVPGQSYLVNNTRTGLDEAGLALAIVAPPNCARLRFEVGLRKRSVDADTAETVVMAIYKDDGATLLALRVCVLAIGATLFTLTADVPGGGEYVVVLWFNHAALGTQGGGGTSARAHVSRCRVVPLGAAMPAPFDGPFWGMQRWVWEFDIDHVSFAPGARGWGADPGPLALLFLPPAGRFHRWWSVERIIFADWAITCCGDHFAAEYGSLGGGTDTVAWSTPVWRTAPTDMTEDRHMSAATMLPPATGTDRHLACVGFADGRGTAARLLVLQSPQQGRVTRAYVGAYAGTDLPPPPAYPRVLMDHGDSIRAGVTYRSDKAPSIQLQSRGGGVGFPGHIIAHDSGGSALGSAVLGYVGAGGVLDPTLQGVRDTFRDMRRRLNLVITEYDNELATNDWVGPGAGVSATNYAIGLHGFVADYEADFPGVFGWLQQPIERDQQDLPNLGGSTLRGDFRNAVISVHLAHPTTTDTRNLEGSNPYRRGDGTHLVDAPDSNDRYVDDRYAWIVPGPP
jgi:hypothetical protein